MITKKTSDMVTRQVLFNPVLHQSIGCTLITSLGSDVDGRKIVRAGTPLLLNLLNRQANALMAHATNPMNAILAHDVDVTNGSATGTGIIFGFINLARVHEDTLALITTARTNANASKLLTFITQE